MYNFSVRRIFSSFCVFLFLSLFSAVSFAQSYNKYELNISLSKGGNGDFLFLQDQFNPVYTFSFSRYYHQNIGFNLELLHYYRSASDNMTGDGLGRFIEDNYLGSRSVLVSISDLERLEQVGITNQSGITSQNKYYTLAFSPTLALRFQLYKRLSLRLYVGPSLLYNNYKWFSNFAASEFEIESGERIPIYYSEKKEVRSLTLGTRTRLELDYRFRDISLGMKMANVNFFFITFFSDVEQTFWDTGIYVAKHF